MNALFHSYLTIYPSIYQYQLYASEFIHNKFLPLSNFYIDKKRTLYYCISVLNK